jgi:hypothetical protein
MAALESQGYQGLAARVGESLVFERAGLRGAQYQFEIDILWDRQPGGPIRVIGSVDDGGVRAFLPLTQGFLLSPPEEATRP